MTAVKDDIILDREKVLLLENVPEELTETRIWHHFRSYGVVDIIFISKRRNAYVAMRFRSDVQTASQITKVEKYELKVRILGNERVKLNLSELNEETRDIIPLDKAYYEMKPIIEEASVVKKSPNKREAVEENIYAQVPHKRPKCHHKRRRGEDLEKAEEIVHRPPNYEEGYIGLSKCIEMENKYNEFLTNLKRSPTRDSDEKLANNYPTPANADKAREVTTDENSTTSSMEPDSEEQDLEAMRLKIQKKLLELENEDENLVSSTTKLKENSPAQLRNKTTTSNSKVMSYPDHLHENRNPSCDSLMEVELPLHTLEEGEVVYVDEDAVSTSGQKCPLDNPELKSCTVR
jgi:hypothetical protein